VSLKNQTTTIKNYHEQVTNLLDELLSTIPNFKRNKEVLNNITHIIERFKQLRGEVVVMVLLRLILLFVPFKKFIYLFNNKNK
jgi:hypothetical protein